MTGKDFQWIGKKTIEVEGESSDLYFCKYCSGVLLNINHKTLDFIQGFEVENAEQSEALPPEETEVPASPSEKIEAIEIITAEQKAAPKPIIQCLCPKCAHGSSTQCLEAKDSCCKKCTG